MPSAFDQYEALAEHVAWAEGTGPRDRRGHFMPYHDTVGKLSIAFGHNLDDNGVTEDVALLLFGNDLRDAVSDCARLSYFTLLDPARKLVVADLVYNLGYPRWLSFVKTNAALAVADYETAADELEWRNPARKWRHSLYWRQTGRRAKKLVRIMRSGTWESSA